MEPSIERSIAERTSEQLGHITRRQLVDLGVSYKQIRSLRSRSRLTQVGVSTFRVAGMPVSWEGSVMAACLDLGGIASHRTAARLHGFTRFSSSTTIDVLVPDGRTDATSELAVVHRTTSLPTDDVVRVQGIPTTGVARTILGLAALPDEVPDESLRDTVDVAVRDDMATDIWLWWHLDRRRCRGRNGVIRMEDLLQDRADSGPTESWLEREFLRLLQGAGLPQPITQQRVSARGAFAARIDCCYDWAKVAIELKGHRHHSTRRQLAQDAARENRLQLLGYRVLVFTYDQVVQTPDYVTATVTEAIASCSTSVLRSSVSIPGHHTA